MVTLELKRLEASQARAEIAILELKKLANEAYPKGAKVRVAHSRNGKTYLNDATVVGAYPHLGYFDARPHILVTVRNDRTGKLRTVCNDAHHNGVPEIELLSVPGLEG